MSVEHASFTIERTYPASPERVFAAWATQAAKSQWFGGDHDHSDDVATTEHTLDFRVGGREHLAASAPDGGPMFTFDAVYQDIVDNERIVWSYDMTMDGRRISVSIGTVTITGVAGGATLVMTEQGAFLDGLDTNAQREAGTKGLLDQLGTILAR